MPDRSTERYADFVRSIAGRYSAWKILTHDGHRWPDHPCDECGSRMSLQQRMLYELLGLRPIQAMPEPVSLTSEEIKRSYDEVVGRFGLGSSSGA